MKKIFVVFLLNVFLLSGCATLNNATHSTDPVTGEKKVNNTTKGVGYGAAGGAALGAIIGAIAGGGKGAALGAGIGAGAGALIGGGSGYYMDSQEKILREKLGKTGVRVVRQGQDIKLIMPANVTFEVNSSTINQHFYETLNSVALVLNEFGNTRLKVFGFTDSQGSFEHNQLLSEDRARSVSSYLIHQGVNPSRLYVQGMSERFPIASNSTRDGRALNRRVELSIEPVNI